MSTPARRLKFAEVADVREDMLAQQGGKCALCKLACTSSEAVLDHDHDTGAIRGVLHRGCNSLLGKVENNHKRYGVKSLPAFLGGASAYISSHRENRTGLLHPTHKTDEEKRLARNAKARKRRAAKETT
jgi:DNA-binding sugar fermentation-stimulating protein